MSQLLSHPAPPDSVPTKPMQHHQRDTITRPFDCVELPITKVHNSLTGTRRGSGSARVAGGGQTQEHQSRSDCGMSMREDRHLRPVDAQNELNLGAGSLVRQDQTVLTWAGVPGNILRLVARTG
ncbi:MAG TPA: hypothetical protein VFH40_03345 [Gemmatimonadales bacterium]|nr:hypothetical protein [Gemmatimonadales bacterium]